MGHEPITKWVVLGVVLAQLTTAILLRHTDPISLWFIFCAYAIGGTLNHNLFLAIHEITHNLAFKGIWANKALAIFANLPIGITRTTDICIMTYNFPSQHRGLLPHLFDFDEKQF